MSNARDIRQYTFTADDHLFLDANVWLAIYGPAGMTWGRITQTYSTAFDAILTARSNIYFDVLVLSEFVNSFARHHFKLLPEVQRDKGFKLFRNSADFKPVAASIADSVRRILKHVQFAPMWFPIADVREVMAEFENSACDINDKLIGQLCQRHGWTLVTDDRDFASVDGLTILTGNRRLLNKRTG